MLYFPLLKGYFPEWIPFFGGNYFSFFDPVFNVADMAISTGVGLLLVFNKQVFPKILQRLKKYKPLCGVTQKSKEHVMRFDTVYEDASAPKNDSPIFIVSSEHSFRNPS